MVGGRAVYLCSKQPQHVIRKANRQPRLQGDGHCTTRHDMPMQRIFTNDMDTWEHFTKVQYITPSLSISNNLPRSFTASTCTQSPGGQTSNESCASVDPILFRFALLFSVPSTDCKGLLELPISFNVKWLHHRGHQLRVLTWQPWIS